VFHTSGYRWLDARACTRALYNETAKHSYPDWRNVIGPTKNGTETPGPHYRSRNEFSLRVAQSVLAGRLAGRFEPPHLNQRCHDQRDSLPSRSPFFQAYAAISFENHRGILDTGTVAMDEAIPATKSEINDPNDPRPISGSRSFKR